MFSPKLPDTLKHYNRKQFGKDIMAGLIVGIVALPLAIAFAVASGVSPQKGIFTAIIAGFTISLLGGSRVQIGGPTGAFIVIVFGIVQTYGVNGLIIATLMAGIILVLMGIAGLGSVIKFIPYPLIVGFTTGIALIIFSSQIKDFLGLKMDALPVDFIGKWQSYIGHIRSVNYYTIGITMLTVLIILLWPKLTRKVPGSLAAIVVTAVAVYCYKLPVETIGSKFGAVSSGFPALRMPHVDVAIIRNLMQPAFTIALLGAIESLLSAVVADGMIGDEHRSNTELIAQGAGNFFSALFGGIPATGAIARTAANIKSGGRTPVAGMVHALTLLLMIVVAGKWAAYIPMAALAGILMVVAYNMSEWKTFLSLLKGPRSDAIVLLITFLLTVLVDLTAAIEIGMVLAVFLFMRNMIRNSNVHWLTESMNDKGEIQDLVSGVIIDQRVEVFEITGPLFFGAVYKFKDAIKFIEKTPRVLIIRMRHVPIIDATGIKALADVYKETKERGTRLILSEVTSDQVLDELKGARLLFAIGKANVTDTFTRAIERSHRILREEQ
ncbi:SulP family inorganic anion transporter [Chitinophagaceae bacterium LWZ2-11]